ncbi:RBBP9/YdeN family alpha/beta hydrolase [Xanthomonas rydalmerensis]|uniref:Alpha/beta hydrolase n=1 Tax=Xanthomonas rydalmerensis TaxID=3046274 RepID=A0ABZ0JN84_9XANT|nr:alpha/beta fold hydrolase [Xanthomonas sp. DM-2023]WOS41274.1 alpha/beta hydrolase [Xanthomonas sp. DM-2023]WOS45459.1 alpha/beta hydrolase [Xanthomonas sp. DM-2023]WOS49638.1 alpha/beta hydrolase [Xanthomonas sp. DM-2023]WOS53818.1 alpha/beta hydrolase [Xanthomonas sp. DM-2023]WOS58001.1 alpha/beta hydrolase [Xanthomonas sp. DM-2023]
MQDVVIVPGIGDSGPEHWQTLWQRQDTRMRRLQPDSFAHPQLQDWLRALDRCVQDCATPPLLVAHSLGCLLVAHWAARADRLPRGAFLVAVPDPDSDAFPHAQAASFVPVPTARLPFPSLIVASSDDPYATPSYSRRCASDWGSGLVELDRLGHLNAASGLGAWPHGAQLLAAFDAGLGPAPASPD